MCIFMVSAGCRLLSHIADITNWFRLQKVLSLPSVQSYKPQSADHSCRQAIARKMCHEASQANVLLIEVAYQEQFAPQRKRKEK